MDILVSSREGVSFVTIHGEIDGKTAPVAQGKVLTAAKENPKILLDLSGVEYMSSAGLRMLLSLYRQLVSDKGKVVLVGVSEMIQDVMDHTGFLRFFCLVNTVEEGLAALKS
jgi:anti-sigma B factor antagonist